jgi:hypothetical protein
MKWIEDCRLQIFLKMKRGEELVTQKEGKLEADQSDLVRVHTVENRFEADLLVQALRQEQIPVMLRRFEETAYDGLFVTQMGWGAILVPGDYEQAARGLIERVLNNVDDKSSSVLEEKTGQ